MTIANPTTPATVTAIEVIDPVLERGAFFAEWDYQFELTAVVPRADVRVAQAVY